MIKWSDVARLEFYMQFPVPQITTLLLLAHLGLGCCWHHAHACDAVACCDSAVNAHRHDAEGDPHQQHENGDRHPHRCDGVHCVFARLGQAPRLGDASAVAVGPWLSAILLHEDSQTDPLLRHRLDHFLLVAGSPLRAHLVYQILLI